MVGIRTMGVVVLVASISALARAEAPAPTPRERWVLRRDGVGPLRYGMTMPQVIRRVGRLTPVEVGTCDLFESVRHPDLSLVFEFGHLVAANVPSSKPAKALRLQVGDDAALIQERFAGGVVRDDGNYDLPYDEKTSSWISTAWDGGFTWEFYVEQGRITHISSMLGAARRLCPD